MINNQVKMVVDRIDIGMGYKRLRMKAASMSPLVPVLGSDGKPVMVDDPHHKDIQREKMQPSSPENDVWAASAINGIFYWTVPEDSTALDRFERGQEVILTIATA